MVDGRPAEDFERAVHVFDKCGAAFYPVAGVGVQHAINGAQLGMVDVAADDAIDIDATSLAGDSGLEVGDE